jgi:glycosyltransferase involved in cell wall biosynthesis
MAKLLFFVAEDWFFHSHFLARATAARDAGFEVVVLAREGAHAAAIRAQGLGFVPLAFRRGGLNPLAELGVIREVLKVYRRERPDTVHHVALKPIIYGTLVARLLGLRRVINAPVGMGYVFTSGDLKARLLRPFVRAMLKAFLHPAGAVVVFENPDDLRSNIEAGAVRADGATLIRGAGVDTRLYRPQPSAREVPVVTLAARMLRDKGVEEFVAAARSLAASGVRARFRLAGASDPANPTSISETRLRSWHEEGVVEWMGHCDDMAGVWASTDIACLPSYREGLPKSLLEALACGLPVVATDVPGCRETVEPGRNGLLVPARDSQALADALRRLIEDAGLRNRFGARSRDKALQEFADDVVVAATLRLYRGAPPEGGPPHE